MPASEAMLAYSTVTKSCSSRMNLVTSAHMHTKHQTNVTKRTRQARKKAVPKPATPHRDIFMRRASRNRRRTLNILRLADDAVAACMMSDK